MAERKENTVCVEDGASRSSSEDEHWQVPRVPVKHSLLSAEQFHLDLWRQVLRQEIEEDIQRQVRDRLGYNLLRRSARSQLSTCDDEIYLRCRGPVRRVPSKRDQQGLQLHNVKSDTHTCATEADGETAQSKQRKSFKRHHHRRHTISTTQPKLPHHVTDHMTDDIKSHMTLYEYVTSKYGVPTEQLTHLSTRKVFQTTQIDSSGKGVGPILHAPTEANILFPTPSHVTLATPTLAERVAPVEYSAIQTVRSSEGPKPAELTKTVTTNSDRVAMTTMVYSGETGSSCVGSGLQFEARFEGGNLHHAVQIGPYEYKLSLNFDLYSSKHTQWFYFKVEGMVAMTTYKFQIVNLYKPDSLYNYGMQPLLYSTLSAKLGHEGWSRVGTNVRYTPTPSTRLHTLSWDMVFPHTEDVCYLAHCYPYPYSKLLALIETLTSCPQRGQHIHRETLCTTLAGNKCPLLTITDHQAPPHEILGRSGVVVSARVHPGETNSSWMMEGLLSMLTGDTPHAKALRSEYVFKVIPMLNPDGVIVGNYRTSLAGVDLNRVYKNTVSELFPTVAATKDMVDSLLAERKVVLYVDLHGHSRKHNVFMYGCQAPQTDHTHFLNERVFPYLLSQQAPQMFSLSSCKYRVERCKESTGRVVMWRRGVTSSFTMEATFCGSTLGHNPQFTSEDLMEMGNALGEAIYKFHRVKTNRSYEQKVLGGLADVLMSSKQSTLPDLVTTHDQTDHENKKKSNRRSLRKFMKFDLTQLNESSTSGSDSENDDFQYKRKKSQKVKRNRRLMSLHTHTQPLLPTLSPHQDPLPSHSSHPSRHPHSSQPHRVSSTVGPLPALTRFSAPPRLQGADKRTSLSWKFIDKYKGRSNGGIPIFSEERMKERAEKQKLRSVSMFQPLTSENMAAKTSEERTTHRKSRPKVSPSFLWQPVAKEGLEIKHTKGQASIEGLVARQQASVAKPLERSKRQCTNVSLRKYNDVRRLLAGQTDKNSLPPALARYIRELWTNN